jgi:hypothetical protein
MRTCFRCSTSSRNAVLGRRLKRQGEDNNQGANFVGDGNRPCVQVECFFFHSFLPCPPLFFSFPVFSSCPSSWEDSR